MSLWHTPQKTITRHEVALSADITIPISVIHGSAEGPNVLITAAVHGCESVGVKAIAQLLRDIDINSVKGRIVCVHALNITGFQSRTVTVVPADGLNLNRHFHQPEQLPADSVTRLTVEWVRDALFPHVDAVIDLHGGNLHEELTPYVYYQGGTQPAVEAMALRMAQAADVPYRVKSQSDSGLYNVAGREFHLPSILLETGYAGRATVEEVALMTQCLRNVCTVLGNFSGDARSFSQVEITHVTDISAAHNGIWYSHVSVGDRVAADSCLGTVTTIFGDVLERIYAPYDGIILFQLGMSAAIQDSHLVTIGYADPQAVS